MMLAPPFVEGFLEDDSKCQEQCTHPAGHEGGHSFECLHTLPPLPPLRPVPVPDEDACSKDIDGALRGRIK